MSTTFRYSPLPEGHIRVLQLKRVFGRNVYELRDKKLDDRLRLRTISYAWGSPALTKSIVCNWKVLPVTRSVYDLLSSPVISTFCAEPLWIDSVCINQSDDVEKAEQVRNMGTIYSLAQEVIIWLGPASSDGDLAMGTIRDVSKRVPSISLLNQAHHVDSKETLQKAGLANTNKQIRSALGSFFCRAWFHRLWVIQEVVLARRRQVVCGSNIIAWDDFTAATFVIGKIIVPVFELIYPYNVSAVRPIQGIHEMKNAAKFRESHPGLMSFVSLLDIAQRKSVTDPRDRVYGMLGMASSLMREKIVVDYSEQGPDALRRLYIDCTKACIMEDHRLNILYMLSGRAKDPDLPSWCPDLNAPPNREFVFQEDWKAGIPTGPEADERRGAWFEPDEDNLYATGWEVDTVSRVVESTFCWSDLEREGYEPKYEDATANLAWERECFTLLKETSTQQEGVPMSYIFTLSEGFLLRTLKDPDITRAAYERNMAFWRDPERSRTLHNDTADSRLKLAALTFHDCLLRNCRGRKFFSTEGGRVGVGPPETQPGDTVCILYRAPQLYLIRFGDYAIQILGNVYTHDLMNFDDIPEVVKGEIETIVIN